ncbi:hypothetical protein BDW02DRAFT_597628 [Decorospora gaudefroyi]|uniref:Uncharacterized protein n=1 Tax=Decorospora gaudefroyi TaxID=184978 RepID=A0A6A5KFW2_9PLEO|nr:hypothetical protein BDW02DRAFT_597628 [Decorospora gaudefroyi]
MSFLYFACLLAICLPLLAVQLSRTPSFSLGSKPSTENRSPPHPPHPPRPPRLRRRLRPGTNPRSEARHGPRETTDGADSGTETGSEEIHMQSRTPTRIVDKGTERTGSVGTEPVRKPWDPPFPRRVTLRGKEREERRNTWNGLPPSPPRKTGREMEAKGVARRLFPLSVDGDGESAEEEHQQQQQQEEETIEVPDRQATSSAAPAPAPPPPSPTTSTPGPPKTKKSKSKIMSMVWLCVAVLAVVVFIFAFAILIAHCLAWFLVYKTEARLGEARRGIVQGGEMRLCLCAT